MAVMIEGRICPNLKIMTAHNTVLKAVTIEGLEGGKEGLPEGPCD